MKNESKKDKVSENINLRNFEEIYTGYSTLVEHTVKAIEDWDDVIPEADVTSQIGAITETAQEIKEAKMEVARLRSELSSIKEGAMISQEEKQKLEAGLKKRERALRHKRCRSD